MNSNSSSAAAAASQQKKTNRRKRRGPRSNKGKRKPRHQREKNQNSNNDCDLTVWVTRCMLSDDHFSKSSSNGKKCAPNNPNVKLKNQQQGNDDDNTSISPASLAQQIMVDKLQEGRPPAPSATAGEPVDATPSRSRENDDVVGANVENKSDSASGDSDEDGASMRKRLKTAAADADGETLKQHGDRVSSPPDDAAAAAESTPTTETATMMPISDIDPTSGRQANADANNADESTAEYGDTVAIGNTAEKSATADDASLQHAVASEESISQHQNQATPTQTILTNKKPTIRVWMSQSARRRLKRLSNQQRNVVELPNGDNGDGIVNPYPTTEVADKYWSQRKRFFTKFDEGCVLDKEGWFSVTPEIIANHTAQRMVAPFRSSPIATTAATTIEAAESTATVDTSETKESADVGIVVLDAFAGVGGNVIAFARRPEVALVICVDTDRNRLVLATKNCAVYEISPDKVIFVHADACRVLDRYKSGVLVAKKQQQEKQEITATTVVGLNEGGDTVAEGTLATAIASTTTENPKTHGYRFGGLDLLPLRLDAIFLSPPWGGIDYQKVGPYHYDIASIDLGGGRNGRDLVQMASRALVEDRKVIAYFLPRNTDAKVLGQAALDAGFRGSIEMEQNVVNGKIKTVTCYTGLSPPGSRA